MAANKTECYRFEQTSVINFWWLRSVNYMKFKECVMCTEKHVLVQKMFTDGLNMGLS